MMMPDEPALLWCLRGHGRDVRCVRRRLASGLELRILWGDELFLTETFHDGGRLEKRAQEFKATLESRGWLPATEEPRADMPVTDSDGAASATPERSAARHSAGKVRREPGRQPHVLIVDDEPSIRAFLREYLEDAGYVVSEAADVDGALNALDQEPADAVVLDVRLPDPMGWGRTGLEVLAFIRLHKASSSLPVLVLTGHSMEPEEHELIRRHRADLFAKPDGYRMLLQRLNQLTGGRAAGL